MHISAFNIKFTRLNRADLITPKTEFKLYDNEKSIQNSLYTDYRSYIMFFSDSIRGLQAGAPVEFRGIRMGTVVQVPYYT